MAKETKIKCTCPSGDGSLSWPCPVHPPSKVIGPMASTKDVNEYFGAVTSGGMHHPDLSSNT